jgi:ABC-type multidrug transport system fused ATPase/permease subunit
VQSYLEGAQVLLPGVFVALVTWLAARFAISGQLTAGQLIAFYGYAVFLVQPLRNLTEAIDKMVKGHVAARRVVRLLNLEPELGDATAAHQPFDGHRALAEGDLHDVTSGLTVAAGRLTAVAAANAEDATAIADRIGRYADADVTLHGVPLRELPLPAVRELILVADNDARLFSGRLREQLDPAGRASAAAIDAALDAASATDVVEALPEGLDDYVAERGREFSGGQQQRLRLARALLVDPAILVLVEPTSAGDAHTEARIAGRLAAARRGRTTLVCTTSPLVLDRADQVAFVEDGKVVATGTHQELLAEDRRYAGTVTREEES